MLLDVRIHKQVDRVEPSRNIAMLGRRYRLVTGSHWRQFAALNRHIRSRARVASPTPSTAAPANLFYLFIVLVVIIELDRIDRLQRQLFLK